MTEEKSVNNNGNNNKNANDVKMKTKRIDNSGTIPFSHENQIEANNLKKNKILPITAVVVNTKTTDNNNNNNNNNNNSNKNGNDNDNSNNNNNNNNNHNIPTHIAPNPPPRKIYATPNRVLGSLSATAKRRAMPCM